MRGVYASPKTEIPPEIDELLEPDRLDTADLSIRGGTGAAMP
jgi:hypothetical protein